MSSAKPDVQRIKQELDKDTRDVSDLWNDALRNYKGIVGVGLTPTYTSVDDMIKAGTEQMNAFHKFRHNEKKVDKLRSLFASNLDYIEKGAQQIVAAATPAFPPAAAIGTALTYMLTACKQVSADYDVVTAFFEDMNAFLQRITILESRLPSYAAYRNCLVDVFTSVLDMCGFATKYIQLKRFKKWILNMLRGEDSELAGARKKMDTRLSRLQAATEYAILGNTEKLQTMNAELKQNEEMQTQMLEEQTKMLETVIEGQDSVRNDLKDIRKLLSVFEEQRKEESHAAGKQKSAMGKPPTSNRVRAFFYDLIDPAHEYDQLKDSLIPEMSTWIFDEPEWSAWLDQSKKEDTSKLLYIAGPPGMGKSHIAVTALDRLTQLAEKDTDGNTCVVHFYFRETRDETRYFCYSVNWFAIQIAEKSAQMCEKINVELSRDDTEINVNDWRDVWDKVLAPLFSSSSPCRLQIVFDGLDELATGAEQRAAGFEFLKAVAESDLNVSVLCTTRSTSTMTTFPTQLDGLGSKSIKVTKEKQLPDLKTLIWHHLDHDSGLKNLSQYMRQRISSTLEEKADCLLYAEYVLRKFNTLNREPLILRNLEQEMPENLEKLYISILSDLARKTNPDQREALKNLFIWLAFSVRPITLSEALAVVKLLPGYLDLEEELQGPQLARFLRIADRIEAVDLSTSPSDTDAEDFQELDNSHEKASDDWNLPLKFQERSMRDFFKVARFDEDPGSLRTSAFEAHRQILVALSRILCADAGTDVSDKLRGYAADCWLMHLGWVWWYNKLGRPTEEQKIELLDAIGAIFNNEGNVATNIEIQDTYYENLGTVGLETKLKFFVTMANELGEARLKESTAAWIRDVESDWKKAFVNLAKAHVQKWFSATELKSAQQSYRFARSALSLTDMKHLIEETNDDEDDEDDMLSSEEILAISKAFPDITVSNSAYAISLLLYDSECYTEVLPHAQQAVEVASSDSTRRIQTTDLLASIHHALENYETAYNTITSVLADTTNVPPLLIRRALVTRGKIEFARDMIDEGMKSYQAARLALPDTPMLGDDLQDQFFALNLKLYDTPAATVDAVKSWSPLERLAWATWEYSANDGEIHLQFQRACGRAQETDFMISAYKEIINLLDAVDGGAPLRLELATAYWKVLGDLSSAQELLNEVLDASSDGREQRFTGEDPSWTLVRAINTLTDILYAEFRATPDPHLKSSVIAQMKGMTTRPLARSLATWKSMANHHRLVLARMVRKMGPMVEYQRILGEAFDASYEALMDNVGWNDSTNLRDLAVVLDVMGGFEEEARVLVSALFSVLDPGVDKDEGEGGEQEKGEGEDEDGGQEDGGEAENDGDCEDEEQKPDDGDIIPDIFWTCDGDCDHPTPWRSYTANGPLYHCTICADVALCEPCHAKRMQFDADPALVARTVGAEFCGRGHRYLKGPVEGWRGVKGGMVRVEGREEVGFAEWLGGLRGKWEGTWREFWVGGD